MTLFEEEKRTIRERLGREPSKEEWSVLDAVWSEHCSYKSSKFFLRSLPSTGERVVMGIEDWQDAGAVDIGDGYALVLKVESHNHPSAIDPFNGAATGVGGIIRDIISKGAYPIALLDMIRIGELNKERNRWLLRNIIKGIGFYGNSVGVPVVGGELSFDSTYDDNPLIDVACLGVVKKDRIVPSVVTEPGLSLVLTGLTGIDGLGGASFASRKLSGEDEIGAVQIADPFAGKINIDSTLEIATKVEAIKDLGGGGLAVAVTEMANGLGAVVELDKVPLRVKGMRPEDIMISETQERMLFAVKPELVDEICEPFFRDKYPCTVIGRTTEDHMIRFIYEGKEIVTLPSEFLLTPPRFVWDFSYEDKPNSEDLPQLTEGVIRRLLSHPDVTSKEWAYSQFDYEVGTSTVIKPGEADGAVILLPNGKYLAIKGDANPDLCASDPYECGKMIFAEAYRNLATVGGKGIVAVDHLQFGDPRKPKVYGAFIEAIRGISEASKVFDVPIVGGKVSFYNENKDGKPIKHTPLIVMAGLLEREPIRPSVKSGQVLVHIGIARNEMDGTLASKVLGFRGRLQRARLHEDLLSSEIVMKLRHPFIKDISRGGLLTAIFPIIVKGYGVKLNLESIESDTKNDLVRMLSEGSGRFIVVTQDPEKVIQSASSRGILAKVIGEVNDESYTLHLREKYDLSKEAEKFVKYLEEMLNVP
jgi:phosphoribosylformylglycinamidine synthase